MKVVLYLRLSTDEQTVEPRWMELSEVCTRRGCMVVAEVEEHASGAKVRRLHVH